MLIANCVINGVLEKQPLSRFFRTLSMEVKPWSMHVALLMLEIVLQFHPYFFWCGGKRKKKNLCIYHNSNAAAEIKRKKPPLFLPFKDTRGTNRAWILCPKRKTQNAHTMILLSHAAYNSLPNDTVMHCLSSFFGPNSYLSNNVFLQPLLQEWLAMHGRTQTWFLCIHFSKAMSANSSIIK